MVFSSKQKKTKIRLSAAAMTVNLTPFVSQRQHVETENPQGQSPLVSSPLAAHLSLNCWRICRGSAGEGCSWMIEASTRASERQSTATAFM